MFPIFKEEAEVKRRWLPQICRCSENAHIDNQSIKVISKIYQKSGKSKALGSSSSSGQFESPDDFSAADARRLKTKGKKLKNRKKKKEDFSNPSTSSGKMQYKNF